MSAQLSRSMNGTKIQTLHSYKCPRCKDEGEILWKDEDGRWFEEDCPCGIKKKRAEQERLKFAEIPVMYKDFVMQDLKSSVYLKPESKKVFSQAGQLVSDWLRKLPEKLKTGEGLYLFSDAKGSGKTMAACCLANEIIKRYEKSVKFTTSLRILDEIKKTWGDKGNAEGKLIEDLSRTEILVIDDFGADSGKDWINERFYSIINGRYVDRKITIFTSNCRISELKYDERITNRILERSLEIPFPEESVREHIAQNLRMQMVQGIGKKG